MCKQILKKRQRPNTIQIFLIVEATMSLILAAIALPLLLTGFMSFKDQKTCRKDNSWLQLHHKIDFTKIILQGGCYKCISGAKTLIVEDIAKMQIHQVSILLSGYVYYLTRFLAEMLNFKRINIYSVSPLYFASGADIKKSLDFAYKFYRFWCAVFVLSRFLQSLS